MQAEIVTLTILQTTDIHSNIAGNIGREGDTDHGGSWLKLASIIKRERHNSGGNQGCLLIDCGDTIQGSYTGALFQGEAAVVVLNRLDYDAWILGNHELDFGVGRLIELTRMCRVPIISGNLVLADSTGFPGYRIYERGEARIAVLGMNSAGLNSWLWGIDRADFKVVSAELAIERIMPELLRQKPDMIVAALHQGYAESDKRGINEIKTLAYKFPQIDLILGGHTHREFAGKLVGNTWYVQAGSHATSLGKITATLDTDKHRVMGIKSQLIPVSDVLPNPDTMAHVSDWIERSKSSAKQQVFTPTTDISSVGFPGKDCHISEIICRAISWKTKAPVVFHGTLSEYSWAKDSVVDEQALFNTIPYENGVGVATLTLMDLRLLIEEQLKYAGKRSFNGIYGVYAEIDKENKKVVSLRFPPGLDVVPDNSIQVAFNSYVIAGGGRRFPVLKKLVNRAGANLQDTRLNTRDVLRDFLANNSDAALPPVSWFREVGLGK